MTDTLNLTVEFSGGTELLFDKQKTLKLSLKADEQGPWTIGRLIEHLGKNYVKERIELFADGKKIRPGILIMVNEVDYEILGGHSYTLKDNDVILFISTLHGG